MNAIFVYYLTRGEKINWPSSLRVVVISCYAHLHVGIVRLDRPGSLQLALEV